MYFCVSFSSSHTLVPPSISKVSLPINIEKVELGQKGGSIKFKGNKFSNPDGLVSLIQSNHKNVKLRPDQSLIYMFDIPRKDHNIERIINLVKEISEL